MEVQECPGLVAKEGNTGLVGRTSGRTTLGESPNATNILDKALVGTVAGLKQS
jgi:hypothetical protein